MLQAIDSFLNRFTMYRFLVYYLTALLGLGFILSVTGVLPVQPDAILSTIAIYVIVCSVTNWVFAKALKIEVNFESTVITALILALISGPVSAFTDPHKAIILAFAGAVAVAGTRLHLPIKSKTLRESRLAFVHQDLGLIPSLTALENFELGNLALESSLYVNWRERRRRFHSVGRRGRSATSRPSLGRRGAGGRPRRRSRRR